MAVMRVPSPSEEMRGFEYPKTVPAPYIPSRAAQEEASRET